MPTPSNISTVFVSAILSTQGEVIFFSTLIPQNKMRCAELWKFFLVLIIGVLIFFWSEYDDHKPVFDNYDPNVTDIKDVLLPFCPKGEKSRRKVDLGLEFMLSQWAPCTLINLFMFIKSVIYGEPPVIKTELKNVTIYDARKQPPGKVINHRKSQMNLIYFQLTTLG